MKRPTQSRWIGLDAAGCNSPYETGSRNRTYNIVMLNEELHTGLWTWEV